MRFSLPRLLRIAAASLALALSACATPVVEQACENVEGLDPGCLIDRTLLKEAVASYRAHYKTVPVGQIVAVTEDGIEIPFTTYWFRTDKFIVVDFSKPAFEKRLYIVDWKTGLVEAYQVSHGRGSAASERSYLANRFTDVIGSGTSSVGAFIGGQEYFSPKWGRAIRVRGLDATNARALERTIVFHSNELFFDKDRNIFGWSCGCFMMDSSDLPRVIDIVRNGGFVYAGPARLYDKASASRVHECSPWCGDQTRCQLATGANGVGVLPTVAAPPPTPDAPPPLLVPNPQPGEVPVPMAKPRQVLTAPVKARAR